MTAAGQTHIPSGSPYPPDQHPADHHFDWEHGRVIEALQLVLIANGRGCIETRVGGLIEIEAGAAFILLPGVWHRYRPDPATGWEESWIEIRGPIVDGLIRMGVCSAQAAVWRGALAAGIDSALAAVHALARTASPCFDPELAAQALGVLAIWARAGHDRPVQPRLLQAVVRAEHLLAERHAEPIDISALVKRLGVSYPHFRRAFRRHTGFAPWQYVLNLRLSRARRLLAASDIKLDALASQLGFSSAFHLSAAFKRAFGVSPDHWRRQLLRSRPGMKDFDSK
ncbi:MAG: AraC family transcriptional regulator [Opitutaceae bacterium]